ncbi:hypothetical protein BGZ73_005807 [Actinomortierella ambigua]|nr:hypothetical protein BGZ73_005807 [Actinomortierella ambigua]
MWPMDEFPEANVHSYIGVLVAVAGNYAHNELSAATPSLEPKASFPPHAQGPPGGQHGGYTMLQGDMMLMESDDNSDNEAAGEATSTTFQSTSHTHPTLPHGTSHGHHHYNFSNTNSNTHSRRSSDEDYLAADNASSQSDISDTIFQARQSFYCEDDEDEDGGVNNHANIDIDNEVRARLVGQNVQHDTETSSSSSNFDYLHSKAWWLGMVLMILGECGNFLAYGFAPASVVAPLGTVALISNVILAPLMLRERFRRRDLIGVVIAIIGAVVVVVNSKSDEVKLTPEAMVVAICQVQFVVYFFMSCLAVVVLASLSDTIGPRYILIDLSVVAIFATKGVSSLLSLSFYKMFTYPIFYLLVFVLVSTAVFQIKYLNKSLQRFDSTQVIPTQFVLFTISAITGSAILYNDFDEMDFVKGLHFLTGCCMTFLGVYFITSQRDNLGQDAQSISVQHHPEWILTPQDAFLTGPAAPTASTAAVNTTIPIGTNGNTGYYGTIGSVASGRYQYPEPERPDSLIEQGGNNSAFDPFSQPSFRQHSFYGRPLRPASIRQSAQGTGSSGVGAGGGGGGGSTTPFGTTPYHNASTPLLNHSMNKADRTSSSLTEAGLSLASSVHNVLSAVGTRHQTALGLGKG